MEPEKILAALELEARALRSNEASADDRRRTRDELIRQAVAAGVPRQRIVEAAGVSVRYVFTVASKVS